jgi:hypothetical protein
MAKGTILVALIAALSVGAVWSQDSEADRTDFSGTWTPLDPAETRDIVILQDDERVRIQQRCGDGSDCELAVLLDGSESISESALWRYASRASWLNHGTLMVNTLITDTTREDNQGMHTTVYTLDWRTENLNITTFSLPRNFRPEGAPQYAKVETISYARQN